MEIYYSNQSSIARIREFYDSHFRPPGRALRRVIDKFCIIYTLLDNISSTRQKKCANRTEENIAAVEASVGEDHNLSIRRWSRQIGLCPSITWKISRNDLSLKAYNIQLVKLLKPLDHRKHRLFGEWAEEPQNFVLR